METNAFEGSRHGGKVGNEVLNHSLMVFSKSSLFNIQLILFHYVKKFFILLYFINRKDISHDRRMGTVVPIYKKKGSVMDCASYQGVKLLEHGMKVVERLLEKRLRRLVKVDQMQFDFMPSRSTVDAIFILRRMQESYLEKNRKLFICFVDLEKAFDRVPRKVIEWALRKKLVPEGWFRQ